MEAVHDRRRILLACAFLPLLVACGSEAVIPAAGRARAEALVAAYAAHLGAEGRTLDAKNDAPFGNSGLYYDESNDTLFGRAFVAPAYAKDAPANELANYRALVRDLNDPAIGGMFDRGGAYFVLDENREAYFLVKALPVPAMEPRSLIASMEALQDIAATWTARWFAQVALIGSGQAPRPTQRVTR
jgi:hypothetical protein